MAFFDPNNTGRPNRRGPAASPRMPRTGGVMPATPRTGGVMPATPRTGGAMPATPRMPRTGGALPPPRMSEGGKAKKPGKRK
jgi:hypothetical protein